MFKVFFSPLLPGEVKIFESVDIESSISFALSLHRSSNVPHDVRLVGPNVELTFTLPVIVKKGSK